MSPRKKVLRKVLDLPVIKGFKPYGPESGKQNSVPVNLLYEEYEAIRLSDYDRLNHQQASEMMAVSRPTFTRIYASALRKIAEAFVEGRQISIEGGKVYFDSDWYQCDNCHCNFNNPEKEKDIKACPLCGNQQIKRYDSDDATEYTAKKSCNDTCYCPDCGFEQVQQPGQACNQQLCPTCNSLMVGKGTQNC
ncbi:MAG: DUF134 domain-containing protein [Paludibacter sp.]|nr:DUF134 domain-containing protein [Paludibacter sp.]